MATGETIIAPDYKGASIIIDQMLFLVEDHYLLTEYIKEIETSVNAVTLYITRQSKSMKLQKLAQKTLPPEKVTELMALMHTLEKNCRIY